MVWCSTCHATLCHGCDVNTHTGQTCNPQPHVREVLDSGKSLDPKDAAPTGSTGPIVDMPNVYLLCAAVCPACGCHDWTSTGIAKTRWLKVIGSSGTFDLDRVSFKCTNCDKVLLAGDPMLYLTKTTVPASLGSDTRTIFTRDLVRLMHSMQRANPGISATAISNALSMQSCSTVRPEHVQTVLNMYEDVQVALEAAADMTDVAKQIAQRGGMRLVGTDMSQKVPPPPPPPIVCVHAPPDKQRAWHVTFSTSHARPLSPLFLLHGSGHALTGSAEQAASPERSRQACQGWPR